jgi:hypothetical protein
MEFIPAMFALCIQFVATFLCLPAAFSVSANGLV